LKKVEGVEAFYEGLLTELIELAKVDPAAHAIVQKWRIQRDEAEAAGPAAPAAKPGGGEPKGK
jgi:hypothetical protein